MLASMAFPREHWAWLYSTNVLEWLKREVKRRTDGVGVFRHGRAVIRLVGAILLELDDEWQVERHSFSQESMRKLYTLAAQREEVAPETTGTPRLAQVR